MEAKLPVIGLEYAVWLRDRGGDPQIGLDYAAWEIEQRMGMWRLPVEARIARALEARKEEA